MHEYTNSKIFILNIQTKYSKVANLIKIAENIYSLLFRYSWDSVVKNLDVLFKDLGRSGITQKSK